MQEGKIMPWKNMLDKVDDAYLPDELILFYQESVELLREQDVDGTEYYLPSNLRRRKCRESHYVQGAVF